MHLGARLLRLMAGECCGTRNGGGLTGAGVAGLAAVSELVGGGGSVVDGKLSDGS